MKDLEKTIVGIMFGKQIEEAKIKHPNQQVLDVYEPEKDEITAKDFEKLRAMKKGEVKKEELESVEEDFGTTAAIAGGALLGAKIGKTVGIYRDAKSRERAGLEKPRKPLERLKASWKGTSHADYGDESKMKKEEVELDESIKTTHENPLVTVHDKNGLHTHANLSVANDIFGTEVKPGDVHKGEVKTKSRAGDVRFNISKHHENAMKEEVEKESKKDFDDRQKRLAAASNETAKDPERLKKLSKIPGYTAAMDLAKKADRRLRMRTEEKDEQEYGYEGDMALNQLKTLVRCAEMIEDMLKPDTDLPEWVQSKITLATDYIQTAADYMYSEMNEELKGNQHKLDKNHNGKVDSGDFKILRGEECPECHKAPCECGHMKEETDVERRTLSFNEFMSQLNEYTPGPGGVTRVQGRSYGAQYRDPEGEDDADEKKKQVAKSEPAVKRGRGRPAGSKSGANQKVTNGRKGSGVDYTGYKLHLPNSNR